MRALILLCAMIMAWSFPAAAASMLTVEVEDLNEKPITLPSGLPAERSLVIVAFQREQQENVDTWVNGMNLPDSDLPWLELPLIDNPGLLMRWFINSGMRRGIPDPKARAHVVTIYTDKAAFLAALGIEDEADVYALVVDRQGNVIENVRGDYSPEGEQILRKALGRK